MIYEWQLYQCRTSHFHFLSEPERPSWPFWSQWAGNLMLDLVSHNTEHWPAKDRDLWECEIARMRQELGKLASQRRRNKLGQFEEGRGDDQFVLPKRQSRRDQGDTAEQWQDFFAGKFGNVFIYVDDVWCQHFPLTCDFIYRRGEKTRDRKKKGWFLKDLMTAFAKPIKVSEKGIVLKEIVA